MQWPYRFRQQRSALRVWVDVGGSGPTKRLVFLARQDENPTLVRRGIRRDGVNRDELAKRDDILAGPEKLRDGLLSRRIRGCQRTSWSGFLPLGT